ncbi:MAG: hypothetical protein ACLTUL_19715 [Blautia faecis]
MLNLTRLEKFDCTRTKLFKEKLLLAGEIGGDPKKDGRRQYYEKISFDV